MSLKILIDQFEGPLDLLLQLIEEQQLDITVLSLAQVTEQFLGYVQALEDKNPALLADFLLIAAKLLVIKSKALLPNLEFGADEEESAFDLTDQLLLYKKYKEIARFLKKLELKRRQSWSREVDLEDRVTFLPDPNLTANLLAQSLGKIAQELKEIIRIPREIMTEVISIQEKIEHIQKLVAKKLEASLSDLISGSKSRTEVIVTFLALLELIKQRILTVEQNELFSDITIRHTNHGNTKA